MNSINQLVKLQRLALAAVAAVGFASVLSACGGAGAGAQGGSLIGGGGGAGGTTLSDASSITLLSSTPNVTTTGKDTVSLTALVKDGANNAKEGVAVKITSTDPGVIIAPKSTKTDASGKLEAEVTITGKTNRTIAFSALTDSLTTTTTVDAAGTRITATGPNTVVQGGTATYSVQLLDQGGTALAGERVTVTSSKGNTLSQDSQTTNSQGKVTLSVTTTQAGSDVLSISAAGASTTQTLSVSATDLQIVAPTQEYRVNTAEPVTVRMRNNGSPIVNAVVRLTATRGTLSVTTAQTDAAGEVRVTINSATAGTTTIAATAPDGTVASITNDFISTTPAILVMQASPNIVGVNQTTSGAQQSSQLLAVVKDASGNPVKGVRVNFTSDRDPSNGRIDSPGFATTDSGGRASIAFLPGPNPTGNLEITLRATVDGASAVTNVISLTAARQELSLRFGTGNTIFDKADGSETTWRVPYTVFVTDSSGNPVKDVLLQASVVSTNFYKGYWQFNTALTTWQATRTQCMSEDLVPGVGNANGRLEAGEDTHPDGMLTPGAVSTAFFADSPSDANPVLQKLTNAGGTAVVYVEYPRDRSVWVSVQLKVTATLPSGTESFSITEFTLPTLAAALSVTTAPPNSAGVVEFPAGSGTFVHKSPYGVDTNCNSTN